jgi:hypothetical protein
MIALWFGATVVVVVDVVGTVDVVGVLGAATIVAVVETAVISSAGTANTRGVNRGMGRA